jgi:hypothetical protein
MNNETNWTVITSAPPLRALLDNAGILWGNRYQRYMENKQGNDDFLSCIICAKPTSEKGESMGVLISEGGSAIVHPDDYTSYPHDGGQMGWYPIGSSCIKNIPAEYRTPNPYADKVYGV